MFNVTGKSEPEGSSSQWETRLTDFPARAVEPRAGISCRLSSITKTCLYNFDPLKPHFYIIKLGFTGVYIIFLISSQNIDYGYLLEPPRRVPTVYVLSRNIKNIRDFYPKIFILLVVKFQYICIGLFS